jgi:hypothetical protein
MVVIIVDFANAKVSCNRSSIEANMYQAQFSVKSLYEQNAWGNVEFTGDVEGNNEWDVFGPYKIDAKLNSDSGCASADWANKAENLATQDGT